MMDRPSNDLGPLYQTCVEIYLRHAPDGQGGCSCGRPGCQARCHAAAVIMASGVDPNSLSATQHQQQLNGHAPAPIPSPITPLRPQPPNRIDTVIGIARVNAQRKGHLYPSHDPYLLRNLIRCARHDLGLVCTLPMRDIVNRVYRCPLRSCLLGALHAVGIEEIVWKAAEQKATLSAIQPEFRQSALEALLHQIIVGGEPRVKYVWRT